MIVSLTKKEKAQFKALEDKYEKLIKDCDREIAKLRSDDLDPDGSKEDAINASRIPEPIELRPQPVEYTAKGEPIYSSNELETYHNTPEYQAYIKANEAANKAIDELYKTWEAAGSEEWRAARKRELELMDEHNAARRQLYSQCEQRQFSELKGNPDAILKDCKNQMRLMIENRYKTAKKDQAQGKRTAYAYIRVDENGDICVDSESCMEDSRKLLHLHYDFFKNDQNKTQTIKAIVIQEIADSPYTGSKGKLFAYLSDGSKAAISTTTKTPKNWLTPIDKVTNIAFDGEGSLYNPKLIGVDISNRKSKKQILSMVSLNYADDAIQISGKKELDPYDREVHDALVTLYVDGENEYMTPQMVYRTMVGNEGARLTAKQQEAISNSVNKLFYTPLKIKASQEECKAYGFDKFTYEGSVIQGEKVTATLNGTVVEVYHLLKQPVLYTYAEKKNQIGRLDIKLLNSPVNKNEENITLQSYLYRRILAMKGSKLSPTIVYDTIYKQLRVEAATDGALRKKKLKVRNTAQQILDYWKQQDFINGYRENTKKTEKVSVTIML